MLPGGERLGFKLFFSLVVVFLSGWWTYKTIKSGRFDALGFDLTRAEKPYGFLAGVVGLCVLCALQTSSLFKLLAEIFAEQ